MFKTSIYKIKKLVSRDHWIFKLRVATSRSLKSEVWEQNFVWLFYYFCFEGIYDVLNPKSPCFLLNKNINFHKNETESKMGSPTYSFREMNLVLQHVYQLRIKIKNLMSESLRKREKCIFCNVCCGRKKFFKYFLCFMSMQ